MRIGGDQSVGALLKALRNVSKSVRWDVMLVLRQMKPEVLAIGLSKAMLHENEFVRRKAAEVIGYYSVDEVRHESLRLVADDSSEEVRRMAQDALQKFERKLQYFDILIPTTFPPQQPMTLRSPARHRH